MVSQTPDRTIFTGSRVPPAWASVTTPGGCPSQRPAGFSRGAVSTFEGEWKHSRKRPLRMALQVEESNELVDSRGVPDAFQRPVPPFILDLRNLRRAWRPFPPNLRHAPAWAARGHQATAGGSQGSSARSQAPGSPRGASCAT